ncbi:Nucleolar protein 13 [Coemansia sp. RSA 2675]|nr:Nucleolar protein 13 [Coemansia sp. RSA 2675]
MSLDAKAADTVAQASEGTAPAVTMADRKATKEQRKAEKHAKQQAKREKRDKKAGRSANKGSDGEDDASVAGSDGEAATATKAKSSKKKKSSKDAKAGEKPASKKHSEWGVWIGNLPYSVTREEIIEFFKPCGGQVTRVNLPKQDGKIRGFAYVDFDSQAPLNLALAYSEQTMGGRAVLIKNASDFAKTGMPSRVAPAISNSAQKGPAAKSGKQSARPEKPPSPSLFVGNLGFDVTKSDLKTIFRQFGEIVGVRVATFEDNKEKCKGFGYVDFKYTDDATKALKSPEVREIGGRRTRIEYAGEEATRKGRPWEFDPKTKNSLIPGGNSKGGIKRARPTRKDDDNDDGNNSAVENSDVDDTPPQFKMEMPPVQKKSRKLKTDNMAETKLQGLPVEFEGQKITFGD